MAKGNWRDNLDNQLFDILAEEGTDAFLELSLGMLDINPRGDKQLRAQVNGEVCEVVLMGLSRKYLELSGNEGRVYHSVVLKDLQDVHGEFRTELDFVMVTPYFMLTTECKSYYGDISISGNCTLSHMGRDTDVYRQSRLHHTHLVRYAEQLSLPGQKLPRPPVFANAFMFSKGRINDRRSEAQRKTIRVLTTSDLVGYYNAMFKRYTKPAFNYERACTVLSKCAASVKLHAQHKKFLGY